MQDHDQLNAAFQRLRNDPYVSTFNSGWRNHLNFFWSQGTWVQPPIQTSNRINNFQGQPNSKFEHFCKSIN